MIAFERTGAFNGHHVLMGCFRPSSIGPDQIKVFPLPERLQQGEVKEVILATNPSMEGDATALYLQQRIAPRH